MTTRKEFSIIKLLVRSKEEKLANQLGIEKYMYFAAYEKHKVVYIKISVNKVFMYQGNRYSILDMHEMLEWLINTNQHNLNLMQVILHGIAKEPYNHISLNFKNVVTEEEMLKRTALL